MTEGENRGLRDAVEVILFTVTEPISSYQIARLLEEGGWVSAEKAMTPGQVEKFIEQLVHEWETEKRPLTALRIAGGYQMATRPEWAGLVAKLQDDHRSHRLSRAALETLAIVAYRQPVIRPDIDAIRGVNSESSLKTLMERGLVTISGRDEGPGRPLLYKTTNDFLKYFGLNSLSDMPDQTELTSLVGTTLTEAERQLELTGDETGQEEVPAVPADEPVAAEAPAFDRADTDRPEDEGMSRDQTARATVTDDDDEDDPEEDDPDGAAHRWGGEEEGEA